MVQSEDYVFLEWRHWTPVLLSFRLMKGPKVTGYWAAQIWQV